MRCLSAVILVLCFCYQSLAIAGSINAKIAVQTTVYKVEPDGSVQRLQPRYGPALNPMWLKSLGKPMLEMTNSDSEPPGESGISAGDVLRYVIRVSNETDFAIPALALQISEEVAPGVSLWRYSPDQSARWDIEPRQHAEALDRDEIRSGVEVLRSNEMASNVKQLRLQNLAPLAVGGQMTFAYDVIVLETQIGAGQISQSSETELEVPRP
jgi:LPS sulfotransferase NodH